MSQTISGAVKAGEYFSIGEPHEQPTLFKALVDFDLFEQCDLLVEELRANPPEPDFVDEEGCIQAHDFTPKLEVYLKEKGLGSIVQPVVSISVSEFPAKPEYCYRGNWR